MCFRKCLAPKSIFMFSMYNLQRLSVFLMAEIALRVKLIVFFGTYLSASEPFFSSLQPLENVSLVGDTAPGEPATASKLPRSQVCASTGKETEGWGLAPKTFAKVYSPKCQKAALDCYAITCQLNLKKLTSRSSTFSRGMFQDINCILRVSKSFQQFPGVVATLMMEVG